MTIDAYSVGTTVVYRTPDGNTNSGTIVVVLITIRQDMRTLAYVVNNGDIVTAADLITAGGQDIDINLKTL